MPDLPSYKNVKLYLRLLGYIKGYWIAFTIALISNFLYSAINAGVIYLLKPILDKGFIARDLHFIKFLPFLILGIFILRGIAGFISDYFMAYVSRGVVMKLRQEIFEHLLKLPASFYDHTSSGLIISAILYNVEQVANAGSDTLSTLVESVGLIIGLLVVMFSISWRISLIYLIIAPAITFFIHINSRRLRRITLKLQKKMGDITSIAEEVVEGYKVVRTFGGQQYETEKFYRFTEKNRKQELKLVATKSFMSSIAQFMAAIALSLTVYLATGAGTSSMLSAGAFASLISAMWSLLKPLKDFTKVNGNFQRGLAGAQTVFALLDEQIERDDGKILLDHIKGNIHFHHVSFQYPYTKKIILKDIHFSVKPGQIVALVGRSGGGKTTLVNLLQRFYEPTAGKIMLDGVDIQKVTLASFRKHFAIVSQHVTLFNDTVRNNIAYGLTQAVDLSIVIEAARDANALDFIEQMPEGFDTLIGENGALLSGGQRQRIAIARAILKKAPILLLDEATSALDSESEQKIQTALLRLMKNKTTFVIAHRLSTIENADLILVIEDGKIIEMGNHKTLLDLGGHYAKLHKMQFSHTHS